MSKNFYPVLFKKFATAYIEAESPEEAETIAREEQVNIEDDVFDQSGQVETDIDFSDTCYDEELEELMYGSLIVTDGEVVTLEQYKKNHPALG